LAPEFKLTTPAALVARAPVAVVSIAVLRVAVPWFSGCFVAWTVSKSPHLVVLRLAPARPVSSVQRPACVCVHVRGSAGNLFGSLGQSVSVIRLEFDSGS